jgi:hypothetical protein
MNKHRILMSISTLGAFIWMVNMGMMLGGCDGGEPAGWRAVTSDRGANLGLGQASGGLANGSMEVPNTVLTDLPNGWRGQIAFFAGLNNFRFRQSDDRPFEGRFSLRIEADEPDDPSEYPYAQQIISGPDIPAGAETRLRARIRTEELESGGYELLLLTPNGQGGFAVIATSGQIAAPGTSDWQEVIAETPSFPLFLTELQVWIRLLPNTTGSLFADDVVLEYRQ